MSWGVDSHGFMQLDPFIRCNSHWVRDFFPVDDAETLKDANRTGAYKYQSIVKILPNYTERELSERELLERRPVVELDEPPVEVHGENREYVNWHWVRHEIEEDAEERKKELAAWRKGKSSRARYKPNDGVLGHSPPEPSWGDGRTSWVEAFPDTWDHLTFQDVLLVKQLANPSKNDPPQVKKLIKEIKVNLKAEMQKAYQPWQVARVWKDFFKSLEQIAPLRENLKEINYDI
tara:strand:+ start:1437 stop:2135 length:699 start_codon:yes stop_codon:yes gene_type:complete